MKEEYATKKYVLEERIRNGSFYNIYMYGRLVKESGNLEVIKQFLGRSFNRTYQNRVVIQFWVAVAVPHQVRNRKQHIFWKETNYERNRNNLFNES